MKKNKIYIVSIILLLGVISILGFGYTKDNTYDWAQDPIKALDIFGKEVNKDETMDTALNDFNPNAGYYQAEFRISNAVDDLRNQIQPYIQRTVYIGLSLAVMAIIYNGLLLVIKPLHGGDEGSAVKKRLKNIIIGVILLLGFYVIIQLLLGLISFILG